MYYPSRYCTYSPKSKDFGTANKEAHDYARKIAKGRTFSCTKAYGWNWSIDIDID